MWNKEDLLPLANAVCCVVREAGAVARTASGNAIKTWVKEYNSPVSEVDITVNHLLQKRLTAIVPEAGWLSEESEDDPARLGARRVWIVDPIDGTRSFIAGRPDWTISVALVEARRPVVAALYAPVSDELFLAVAGAGATRNGVPIAPTLGATVEGARIAGARVFSTASPLSLPHSRFCPRSIPWRCGSPVSPTARSMQRLPAAPATIGTLRLPIFWCTKPGVR